MKIGQQNKSSLFNRLFLLIIFGVFSLFGCLFAGPVEKKQQTVPFKTLYNHDGTNMLSCLSPWCPENVA